MDRQTNIDFDLDDEILTPSVSDEALEIAAGSPVAVTSLGPPWIVTVCTCGGRE